MFKERNLRVYVSALVIAASTLVELPQSSIQLKTSVIRQAVLASEEDDIFSEEKRGVKIPTSRNRPPLRER